MQGNLLGNSAVLLVETPAAVLKYCIGVTPCTLVVMLHEQNIFYWNVVCGGSSTDRLSVMVKRSNGVAAIGNNSSYVLDLLSWVRCLAVDIGAIYKQQKLTGFLM